MFIILDNAESVLDPQGTDAQDIYATVEELCQFTNICLLITSRISTVPPACKGLDVPVLSMEAARNTFYRIYASGERSDLVDDILNQLDLHPLSITLLATVAHQNKWDTYRLTEEWKMRRTDVLHTQHNKSLAAIIELSLSSPMFQALGPDARGLLGVISFFPRGVDGRNIDWLFPTIANKKHIFDNFCVLSLTYRFDGSIRMLAPLRDCLCPKEPMLSPLLCATKERYFDRLSVGVYPGKPGFEEARWITSEDANVEHLLDVFTTVNAKSENVWDVCSYFMEHLRQHKPRPVMFGPKVESLPDDHPSKLRCSYELADLLHLVGRFAECKTLLTRTLKLCRKRGDDISLVGALGLLAHTNQLLGLHKEGIQQARGASEICEKLKDVFKLAHSLFYLAWSLYEDDQLDTAGETASQAICILPGDQSLVCQCHRLLGNIHKNKGEVEKAIEHFEVALRIASSFGWNNEQLWGCCSLARLFGEEGRIDEAQAYLERAKPHAAHSAYFLGRTIDLQARLWRKQYRLEEARSEALRAVDLYEKMGAAKALEVSRSLIVEIDADMKSLRDRS